jgi:hypothetical protein
VCTANHATRVALHKGRQLVLVTGHLNRNEIFVVIDAALDEEVLALSSI